MASITEQYRIITAGAGWIDRSSRGRIKLEGPDAPAFLQGLLSNDVAALAPGQGVYATWLTPNGRMLADPVVLDRAGHLTCLVGEGQGPALAARLDQLVFTEELTVTDVTAESGEVFVTGGRAAEIVGQAAGLEPARLEALPELGHLATAAGFVMRDGASTLPAFRIVVAADAREATRAALEAAGAVELDPQLATALRIEAGRGEWGPDLEDVIPLEAGLLDRAISTTKGCYVGQEIVIRMLHRGGGRVAKRLVVLAFDPQAAPAPEPGSSLEAGGAAVGRLTSVGWSPVRGTHVALAYLQRDAAEVGRTVTVAGSGASAEVVALAQ